MLNQEDAVSTSTLTHMYTRRALFEKCFLHVQVQDAEEVRQLRQSLQFRARPAPLRTKPVFAPDHRLAQPPTQPKPFTLATSIRCSMDMLGTSTYTQSCMHHAADDSGDEDFEDDEDLDDGSGCSELDERQTQHPIESNLGSSLSPLRVNNQSTEYGIEITSNHLHGRQRMQASSNVSPTATQGSTIAACQQDTKNRRDARI